MSDYLLLAGVALSLVSVVLAMAQLSRTEAPRGAAIALVAGIVCLFAGAYLDPEPFSPGDICTAWENLLEDLSGSPE